MTIFGRDAQDFFIPPVVRGGADANLSLQEVLVGRSGKLGIIPYYTEILSAIAAFISFCYIVKAGYTMFTAFGDEAKYTEGKKTLLYAVIGFAISLTAWVIITLFVRALGYSGELK